MVDAESGRGPAEDRYERLIERYAQLTYLEDIEGSLEWDELTRLPAGGQRARAKQLGALSTVLQEKRADPAFGDLLEPLASEELADDRRAVVREIRREYERSATVPSDLTARLAEATSDAKESWQRAKAEDDFGLFEAALERVIALKREEAAAIDPDADPYAVLVAEYTPYTDLETIDRVFGDLGERLVPMLDAIRPSAGRLASGAFQGSFDPDDQVAAHEALLDELGFDRTRGTTGTVPNAVTIGNQHDCRVGLWPIEDRLEIGLRAVIHEFGHALYLQNLPREHYGTPLGQPCNVFVNESQAVFWEAQIGGTEAFWRFAEPILHEHLPTLDASARDLYESFVRVRFDEPNALRADELTYQLHTLVRYEIEKRLVRGELDVADIPAVFRDLYERYLGFRPESDAEGPLLSIHWAGGHVGYFPAYTLGHVLAAQLGAAARDAIPEFEAAVARGEFEPIRRWLAEEIHRHGQRYRPAELIRRATGTDLEADPYLDYVEGKYAELYEVDL